MIPDDYMIPDKVKDTMERLNKANFDAYLVGGAVRDLLLGEEPKDWDIFTNANGEEIIKLFPDGVVIGGEERQKKILTVVVSNAVVGHDPSCGIEVSSYRASGDRRETGNDLITHLSTCDLTFNSLAMNLEMLLKFNDEIIGHPLQYDPIDWDEYVIDPYNGLYDLGLTRDSKHIEIKFVGDPLERLSEDKLRAFRGARFLSKYNGILEYSTEQAIKNVDVSSLPPDRIRDEILKIFKYKSGFRNLVETGLIFKSIPELEKLRNLDGGHFHNEGVLEHSILAYETCCDLTDNVYLRLACAFHDIGKGPCAGLNDKGLIHFKGHDAVGSKMMEEIMTRLRFSTQSIEYVTKLIKHHIFGISGEPRPDKGYARLYEDLEKVSKRENTSFPNIVEDLTLLFYCDFQGNLANERAKYHDYLHSDGYGKKDRMGPKITRMYYDMQSKRVPFTAKDLKVTGNDIISLGVPGGKRVGELLQEVFRLTTEGILRNERHEQMFWLREQLRIEKDIVEKRGGQNGK